MVVANVVGVWRLCHVIRAVMSLDARMSLDERRRTRHGAHGVGRMAGALLETVANGAALQRRPRVLWVPGRQSMTLGPSRAWPNPEARHIVCNVCRCGICSMYI